MALGANPLGANPLGIAPASSEINSAEKRKSISGINYFMPGVTPNSGQDQEWRQEAGYSYSGILALNPSPATGKRAGSLMMMGVGH